MFNVMRVEKHALSSTFKVPHKTSIPGDSSEHKVTIARLEFELLVGLECFPYVTTDVYETASALNNSNYPLLRGPAAVYLDQKFTSDVSSG
ncbi:protein F37C4.5-like protein [Aphelenchoides avenae]|nr:protein F37C4.5-like protein [Aphelenchus avenae]